MCTADSDLPCNVQSCFAKKYIMVIGNHGFYTKEKWMHYVILITHQSDIKICTTNFSDLPVNDKSHYSHSNRCSFSQHVCAMRRSPITFRFKSSKAFCPMPPPPATANMVQLTTMYGCTKKKLRGLPEWLVALGIDVYAHFAKTERKKSYLNHGGVNLKNRGGKKWKSEFLSPNIEWWGHDCEWCQAEEAWVGDVDRNRFARVAKIFVP